MYSAGFLDRRAVIFNRAAHTKGDFGREAGAYTRAGDVWCALGQTKGKQAIREGMIEAYEVCTIYMRYNELVKKDSRFLVDGKMYKQMVAPVIDKRACTIQCIVQEIVD